MALCRLQLTPLLPLLLLLQLLLTPAAVATASEQVLIDGDVMLGGLFPIRSWPRRPEFDCGRFYGASAIQRLEAMIFALMEVNERQDELLRYGRHRISLGGLLLDTCSKDTRALKETLKFLRSFQNPENSDVSEDADLVCEYPNGTRLPARRPDGRRASRKPIRGVVGGAYSQVSVQVANLLRLFAIPQISYASTSAALSDKIRFEFFARTVPSDTEQAKALADIVSFFNWSYVSTVFSKGDYGEGGIQSFEAEVDKMNVCIAERLLINLDPTKEELDSIVERLFKQRLARVVVMFTREDHTEKFLDAVRRANITDHFVWISADGWGKSNLPVANNSLVATGALTLEISTSEIPRFNRYYTSLQPNVQRTCGSVNFTNPFFDQFWQQKFDCRLSPASGRRSSRRSCNDSLSISATAFKQEPKVQFVYDAVYAFAHGLETVKQLVCLPQPAAADTKATGHFRSCVRNITSFPGKAFYNILRQSNFTNSASRRVEFNDKGDGMVPYRIFQFDGKSYRQVGEWRRGSGTRWTRDIRWPGGSRQAPESRCSSECPPGHVRRYSSGRRCCWSCAACPPGHVADGEDCVVG